MGAFVARELRAPEPMLPMRLFRKRAFSAGNAAIFFTLASLSGAVFFFAQMLQTALGYGPLDAGLRLIPWTITFITVAPVVGSLVDRFGERPFMVAGLTLQALGHGLDRADRGPRPDLLGVRGPGGDRRRRRLDGDSRRRRTRWSAPSPTTSVGKAAGANSMMRELGGVFGIAVAVAVFAGAGSFASPAAFLDGFAPAMAVLARVLRRRRDRRRWRCRAGCESRAMDFRLPPYLNWKWQD